MPIPVLRSWNVGLVAVAVVALITEAVVRANGAPGLGVYLLALAAAAPLAWRTLTPLGALVGVAVGALACTAAFHATFSATAMIMVELYTIAVLGRRQRSIVVGAVTASGVVLAIVSVDGVLDLGGVAIRVPLVFAVLAVGDTVRSRRALREAARERAELEAHEREEEGRRRVADERLRIARELHDTLAHSLVAINVRAAVTLDLHDPTEPTLALQDIKQASATALQDLRATLNLLRDQNEAAPTTPTSGLAELPQLLDRARATGLDANIEMEINGSVIPSAVEGATFRIVQEALTNVLRHAHASHARVRVHAHRDALHVDVSDDGQVDSAGVSPGLGLRGMAERATALGGHVDAGPCSDGGWTVRATFPLKESAA